MPAGAALRRGVDRDDGAVANRPGAQGERSSACRHHLTPTSSATGWLGGPNSPSLHRGGRHQDTVIASGGVLLCGHIRALKALASVGGDGAMVGKRSTTVARAGGRRWPRDGRDAAKRIIPCLTSRGARSSRGPRFLTSATAGRPGGGGPSTIAGGGRTGLPGHHGVPRAERHHDRRGGQDGGTRPSMRLTWGAGSARWKIIHALLRAGATRVPTRRRSRSRS